MYSYVNCGILIAGINNINYFVETEHSHTATDYFLLFKKWFY